MWHGQLGVGGSLGCGGKLQTLSLKFREVSGILFEFEFKFPELSLLHGLDDPLASEMHDRNSARYIIFFHMSVRFLHRKLWATPTAGRSGERLSVRPVLAWRARRRSWLPNQSSV